MLDVLELALVQYADSASGQIVLQIKIDSQSLLVSTSMT